MKRIFILFVIAALVISLLALPTLAAEETQSNSFWDGMLESLLRQCLGWLKFENFTITEGGFNYISPNSPINTLIAALYNVTYPIGVIIMLLTWAFGLAKGTATVAFDIKDKNSFIHSIVGLIVGLTVMTLAPRIMTLLTGVSQWLCSEISEKIFWHISGDPATYESFANGALQKIFTSGGIPGMFFDEIIAFDAGVLYVVIVIAVVEIIFMLNIAWITLLQILSPIFIGLWTSNGGKKIAFNFCKEYIKAMLIPVITIIYFGISIVMLNVNNATFGTSLIVSLGLAISTLGIAGKKLDKLIN